MTNKDFFIQRWQAELPRTIIALKALPCAEKLSYRPASKNRSAKELVDHFVSHAEDLIEALEDGVINHRVMANYASIDEAINAMRAQGAIIVDPVTVPHLAELSDPELVVMAYEFKNDVNNYLAGRKGLKVKTLADLIAFNQECFGAGNWIGAVGDVSSGELGRVTDKLAHMMMV